MTDQPVFDAHLHIIDPRFPLVPNQGYLPEPFRVADYRARTADLDFLGGAVVSGSFQGADQGYLRAALAELGPGFVGVTQLPTEIRDADILELDRTGARAVRFNLYRGGDMQPRAVEQLARRVHDLAGWHAEFYVDACALTELMPILKQLPRLSIDHLGLSAACFEDLLRLVEVGGYVKATGFGRTDLDAGEAARRICEVNPGALMFGSDLPSTRAPRPFEDHDLERLAEHLDEATLSRVLHDNAVALYVPDKNN